jgi:hypothetical protein
LINAFIDSDDEPFYDKVASDEEYNNGQQKRIKINKKSKKVEIYKNDYFLKDFLFFSKF